MMRRAALVRKTPMARSSAPIKRRTPKKRPDYHEPKYLAACKGESCYLRLQGVCQGETETVVPCHANWSAYGKGMGIKAKDIYTVPGCWRCHAELDQGFSLTNEQKRASWEWAYNCWVPVRALKVGSA